MNRDARIGVVGATGAVGPVTIDLLRERGYEHIRAFASARSVGTHVAGIVVEEATRHVLSRGDLDLCLFSIGTAASRELVPAAVDGGAVAIDKSSAYRLQDGVPLVVPEVNGRRALAHAGIIANPNCSTIPLALVLKPLHERAGIARVRVSTYQAASGAGIDAMRALEALPSAEGNVTMDDWEFDGFETDEEAKVCAETRKILELPQLPISATTVRVPVMVGHSEAVWIETEDRLSPEEATAVLADTPSITLEEFPTPRKAAGRDDVLVGRIRPDTTSANGLVLFLSCDNLRKGAALNAIQIAELLLKRRPVAA